MKLVHPGVYFFQNKVIHSNYKGFTPDHVICCMKSCMPLD